MKPSPTLCHRIPFTTKEVGRGFYRGTRTGAMGAHTEYGGYVIDYRKVRHFNVPDLTNFKLTPFVSKSIDPKDKLPRRKDEDGRHYEPKRVDGLKFLERWSDENVKEYEELWNKQEEEEAEREKTMEVAGGQTREMEQSAERGRVTAPA